MHLNLASEFAALCESSDELPDVFAFLRQHPCASPAETLHILLRDQQQRWSAGQPLMVEDYLARVPEVAAARDAKLRLAVGEFRARQASGSRPDVAAFVARFAELGDALTAELLQPAAKGPGGAADPYPTQCSPTDTRGGRRIGRYRLQRLLGEGTFGRVWLGFDDELQRQVAIKVPTPERFQQPGDAEAYLAEARIVASLDHPHIVPVYDVGHAGDGSVYVVSKFIEGGNLAQRIQRDRPGSAQAAALIATVARALHHAHQRRLIHRDVKPANILLDDRTETPYVADFGLAVREEDFLRDQGLAGTPGYMSPEQARGEGHRLDGRSDVFSLGVVLYELLTGKRPFRGSTGNELLHQVISVDPPPPRELDPAVPVELERICLKALSKRVSDRYATAAEMADDLAHWQQGPQAAARDLAIVPKGLRAFDADDADFFLDLLPGPRNRDGLPESIQFWKSRLEDTDADRTFSVGMIYGPSGCGKSSLVKAGLLPRLANHVQAVYVEATPEETEIRLLRALRKRLPNVEGELGLVAALAAIRRCGGPKVVMVLDQFEQWLHAHKTDHDSELISALRQCDGGQLQAVVMVRDDFAMAATRFMGLLDIPIVQGHNFATLDLFDIGHAEKVLIKFGQAFARLPAQASGMSDSERAFVASAASGLAQDGQVVCVRLALFAEMVKGKAWVPATLEQVGGTAGVGVNFLEETFSSRAANPQHRLHQQAARAVLKALLPEVGTDIKGNMRSLDELLEASGYRDRPPAFHDLLRILDGELRLITPTDPQGSHGDSLGLGGFQYYQLTHDYLVPSLREWLTRKQRETRRGRAELLLAERASDWNARPENRLLPTVAEWDRIVLFTRRADWTASQRRMMRRATRHHALRAGTMLALLALLLFSGILARGRVIEQQNATRAQGLVEALANAEINQVPAIIHNLAGYRTWADPLLAETFHRSRDDSRPKLHAALALLPVNPSQKDFLYRRLLTANPQEVPVISDALAPHKNDFVDKLWGVVEQPPQEAQAWRLRAACALAAFDPDGARWKQVRANVADDLVKVPAVHLATWVASLRPVRAHLVEPLAEVFRSARRSEIERSLATDILADYAADQAATLADLVMHANEQQFAVIFPKLRSFGPAGAGLLSAELDKPPLAPGERSEEDQERLARRQANAAVALLSMDRPEKVWPLLRHSPDPRVRSYLIHRFCPMGADPKALAARLESEPDVSARRALVLALGEYSVAALPPPERSRIAGLLRDWFLHDEDPGLHAAAAWTLAQWKQSPPLPASTPSRPPGGHRPRWFVNGQGQTMVAIPGPVEFMMGSPATEATRIEVEVWHRQRIGRSFAIAATLVTVGQYFRFQNDFANGDDVPRFAPERDCPILATTWYHAAAYCNWLSQQEGLPEAQWCYVPNGDGKYEQGMKPAADFLQRTGYRLPTEAEWEYACRAGAATSRYYGESDELLGKYGVYQVNSGERTWPVGSLKPNDLGLFDMYGNVWEWCTDPYRDYTPARDGAAVDDAGDPAPVQESMRMILRGGGFYYPSRYLRSAYRYPLQPGIRLASYGFRVAKTEP